MKPWSKRTSINWLICLSCSLFTVIYPHRENKPSRFYLDGVEWGIKYVDSIPNPDPLDEMEEVGWTDCTSRFIKVVPEKEEKNTIIHELLHAMTCEGPILRNNRYNSSSEEEHEGIYFSANKWTSFLQDRRNKKLIDYLSRK